MTKTKNKYTTIFLSLLVISIFYFFTRFQNLTSIPVFCDEAIYIRWAQIIRNVETLRFIPLTDGKQPLFMWLLAFGPLQFITDPLVAGRLISIVSGWITLLALFISTCLITNFNQKSKNILSFLASSIKQKHPTGLIATVIYVFLPFTFFFDRLATPDNLLSTFVIISFLLTLLLSKFPRLDLALILGGFLGLAWLTKSPAIYFLVLSFATFAFTNYHQTKKLIYPAISVFIAYIFYNSLRLGPQFHMIAIRNQDYVWPLFEILKHPLDPLKPHISDTLSIFTKFISWPLILLSILGIFGKKAKVRQQHLILWLWPLLPFMATASLTKVFTSRYILFIIPFFIIILAIGLKKIPKIFIVLVFSLNIIFIYNISQKPFSQQLPSTETGYLVGWTSGWGIKQSADYLKTRAQQANVIVGTEGSFGTLPDGLQIYTDGTPQLTVIGMGLGFTRIPDQLIDAKNYGDEVYLLINRSRLTIPDYNSFTILKQYPKPDGDQLLLLKI